MKTLTYGTLPDFSEFAQAFDNTTPYQYEIRCGASDARMFEATGAPYSTVYTMAQLWDLLESLTCIADGHVSHGEPWTDEQMQWAGDFAGSILTTLGFEWI